MGRSGIIHAAVCRPGRPDLPAAWMLSRLSPAEQERYLGFRGQTAARQYLASRWLLRTHLSGLLHIPVHELDIDYPDGAAPRLGNSDWRIGLSHSGGAIFCAVARGVPVGCDIERHRWRFRLRQIAASYFTEQEAAHLDAVGDDQLIDDFYRLWTLKEAGMKALGSGLSSGLTSPSFEWQPDFRCRTTPDHQAWAFAYAQMENGKDKYNLGLALNSDHLSVEMKEYDVQSGTACRKPEDFEWVFIAPLAAVRNG